MKFKSYLTIVSILLLSIFVTSCELTDASDPERVQVKQTQKILSEMNRQIGMPNIVNFQQKKLMKMIYEQCDREDLICYAYLYNSIKGSVGQFLGKCLGYGVPFSAQYTNPMKVVDYADGYKLSNHHFGTLPQADPNGLNKYGPLYCEVQRKTSLIAGNSLWKDNPQRSLESTTLSIEMEEFIP